MYDPLGIEQAAPASKYDPLGIEESSWGVEDTARASAAVIGGFAAMPVAGVGGLSRLITTGDLTEANKTIEGISGVPSNILTTDRQREAAEKVGHLISWPFVKAGKGLAGIAELVSTGDLQKATDVIEGRDVGSNISVPIADIAGQVAGMGGIGGAAKATKGLVTDALKAVTAKRLESSMAYTPSAEVPTLPVNVTPKAQEKVSAKPTAPEELARLEAKPKYDPLGIESEKITPESAPVEPIPSVEIEGKAEVLPEKALAAEPIKAPDVKTLWHGTNEDFTTFDNSLQYSRGQMGIHLGDKEAAGNIFGETPPKRIIAAEVDIKNPLRLDDLGAWQGAEVVKMVNEKIGSKLPLSAPDNAIREAIQKAGYDGVVYENMFESNIDGVPSDSYIAFSPKQVRPVTEAKIGAARPEVIEATPATKGLKPEVGTPETIPEGKESKLAIRAESAAIEAKLTEDFGDLVDYKTMSMKEQAEAAQQVMDFDYGSAKRMAMGEELPPKGIREATMYEAVKIRALREGDVETLRKLATESTVPRKLSEYGQAIKAADSRQMLDPVADMQDIAKVRTETAKKAGKRAEDIGKQAAEIERLNQELTTAQKNLADFEAKKVEAEKQAAIDNLLKPEKTQPKKPPEPKTAYGSKNKIVTQTEYERVKAELRKKLIGQFNVGLDPTIAADLTRIGAYHFEAGARVFGEWSARMVEDFGDFVKPHLKQLWEQGKAIVDSKDVEILAGKISKSVADGKDFPDIGRQVQALAKQFVEMGIKDREKLVDAVHDVLKKAMPDITRRETMDAISGYGKYKLLSKEELDATLRDLKGQMQQVAKLEDLQAKGTAEKTGVERRTPSDEERRLIKLVNDAKKKFGIQTVDKETQLKSSLDAIKTRLTNDIADLESQIASRQKIVKDKTGIVYDAEANKLKARRDELKKEFDGIFGKPQMTDAQRTEMAIKAVNKSIAEYTRKIAEKDLSPMTKKRPELQSEELSKLRAEREGLRDQLKELRDLANPKKTAEQIATQSLKTRLRNEEKKLREKLDNRDFSVKEKRSVLLDPEAQILKAKRDQAKENYNAAAQASHTITPDEATNLVELSRVALDAKAAMEQGGDRFAYGAARVAYENYVNGLKGANDPIKTLLKRRGQEFKTTWGESKAGAVVDLVKDTLSTIADNSVAMVATLDNSFLGRQGLHTLMTHPTRWLPAAKMSFIDFYRTLGGKNAHDALMADIYSRPNFFNGEYQRAGIIAKTEEQFPTSLPERIPGVGRVFRASEYAFTGSGLRMRTGLYDLLAERAKANGVDMGKKAEIESLGRMINSLTARGKTGQRGEGGVVKMVLWAPKMLKGNWDVLTAHSLSFKDNRLTSFAQKEAGKNLLKIVVETATLMAIANALKPGSAETDPRSPDFGKIKAGDTRFDFTGGAGSIITLASRIVTGETKSSTTGKVTKYEQGFGKRTRFDALIDFLANKTNPPASIVRDWLRGRNFKGEKFTPGKAIYQAGTPIMVQQAIELKDNASADRVAGVIADAVGISSVSYDKKKPK